jgi:hypothetical protein
MKKFIVKVENYANHPYPEYFNRGIEISKPDNPPFEIGEVVVITRENEIEIGVVLGWVDISYWELRTDMAGMVGMDNLRSATLEDFTKPGVRFVPRLLEECLKLNPQY